MVPGGSNKEAVRLQINCEVVEPASTLRQADGPLQGKRQSHLCLRTRSAKPHKEGGCNHYFHDDSFR
jgi:hypothetical protein